MAHILVSHLPSGGGIYRVVGHKPEVKLCDCFHRVASQHQQLAKSMFDTLFSAEGCCIITRVISSEQIFRTPGTMIGHLSEGKRGVFNVSFMVD